MIRADLEQRTQVKCISSKAYNEMEQLGLNNNILVRRSGVLEFTVTACQGVWPTVIQPYRFGMPFDTTPEKAR